MSLAQRAVEVLLTASPEEKTKKSATLAAEWRAGAIKEIGTAYPPMQPARPAKPEILPPGKMPRRGPGGTGKATLMHALAHIEFNAIDLAWDIIARFTEHDLPRDFYDDWAAITAPSPPMPACGKPPKRPLTTFRRASPWYR